MSNLDKQIRNVLNGRVDGILVSEQEAIDFVKSLVANEREKAWKEGWNARNEAPYSEQGKSANGIFKGLKSKEDKLWGKQDD